MCMYYTYVVGIPHSSAFGKDKCRASMDGTAPLRTAAAHFTHFFNFTMMTNVVAARIPTANSRRFRTIFSFGPLLSTLLLSTARQFSASAYNMSKDKINNLVFSIAMEDEAKPFIDHLGLKADADFFPKEAPFHAFTGSYKNCEVTVVTSGKDTVHDTGVDNVGTVPAAVATFLALQKLDGKADLLINAGTCGGFKAMDAHIGDVFLTTGAANHDRRIPIPAFEPYGYGFVKSVSVPQLKALIGAKEGVCTTGNSLDKHDIDDYHMKKNEASVKDMEAAAIGWACELHSMPHFGLKVVTDIVDGDKPTQEEFLENLQTAAKSLQETLPKVIEHVCGRDHDEL